MRNYLIIIFAFMTMATTSSSVKAYPWQDLQHSETCEMLLNSSFEHGLSEWDYSGSVKTKRQWAGVRRPDKKGRMAVMSPMAAFPSSLSQSFIKTQQGFSSIAVSFDYNLWAWGFMGASKRGCDDFIVSLVNEDYTFDEELLRVSFKDKRKKGPTIHGWEHYYGELNLDTDWTTLSLVFELDNFKKPYQFSIAYLDNIHVVSKSCEIPIPSGGILSISGLTAILLLRRRLSR